MNLEVLENRVIEIEKEVQKIRSEIQKMQSNNTKLSLDSMISIIEEDLPDEIDIDKTIDDIRDR